jgi:hypothetical protein
MTEARGLFYTFLIFVAVVTAGIVGIITLRNSGGCSSYTMETNPGTQTLACYVADNSCELVCASLESVVKALQKQRGNSI